MYFKKLLYLLLLIAFTTSAKSQSAQTNSLDSFSAKIITNIKANDKPRAYLVTDKSVYRAGEYIWFRAFLLNTVSQKLTGKNKFLFVDMVNDKDDVVSRVILDAADKQLSSRILFPDTLTGGYYWLRAYTAQMVETDTNNIYIKPLYVVGKTNNNNRSALKNNNGNKDDAPTINFYPEGGNIVPGINCTVALQTSIKNSAPLSINGYIKDSLDVIITQFTTNKNGLGKFDFEPSGYRKYKAVINWNGKEISYPLPPFNFYTGQLSVLKESGAFKLRILLGDSIYTKDALTYLVGISRDSLVFASIGHGQYETIIDEQQLPAGITTFYLFDKDFKPLSERSVHVNSNNVRVNITTDKNIYTNQDKVTLSLAITDVAQHVIPALVAVSVSDSIFSDADKQCNFDNVSLNQNEIDNLFLADNNCFSDDDIGLMMLTKNNTYQSFINSNGEPSAADYDSLLFIKGVVLNEKNGPLPGRVVTIISTSGTTFFNTDTTDNAGRFRFPFDKYPDSTKFTLDVKKLNGVKQTAQILLDTLAIPKLHTPIALKKYLITEPKQAKQRFNSYYKTQLTDDDENKLPTVTVKVQIAPDYDVSKRVSQYSSILSSKDLNPNTPLNISILKVSGLQILNGFLVMHGISALQSPGPKSEPLLLVEGSEVNASSSDDIGNVSPVLSYLHSLNPKDIDFIEVLKEAEAAAYGVRGGNGVILINLKNKQQFAPGKNNTQIFYVKGVEQPELFPTINYDQKNKKDPMPDDSRSTLFWNGELLTADAGNPTISFYTSSIPATYNITVTGITIHGDIIHKTISFQSK